MKKLGLTNLRMLHTADPKVANTETFAAMLRDAKCVWFNGGQQWNCIDMKTRKIETYGTGVLDSAKIKDSVGTR